MSFAHYDEIHKICCEHDDNELMLRSRLEQMDLFPEGYTDEKLVRQTNRLNPMTFRTNPFIEEEAVYTIRYGQLV